MKIDERWGYKHYPNKASFLSRVLAYIIDAVILSIVIIILYLSSLYLFDITLSEFVLPLIIVGYRVLMHWQKGATIGKLQSDIRVQNEDGKRINLTQSLLRESIYIIYLIIDVFATYSNNQSGVLSAHFYEYMLSAFSFLLLIDVLWAIGKSRNALHDIISKTYCYQK